MPKERTRRSRPAPWKRVAPVVAIAVISLAAVALAGCGGDDEEGEPTGGATAVETVVSEPADPVSAIGPGISVPEALRKLTPAGSVSVTVSDVAFIGPLFDTTIV